MEMRPIKRERNKHEGEENPEGKLEKRGMQKDRKGEM